MPGQEDGRDIQARLGKTIDTDADKLSEELSELQKDASIQAVRGGGEGDVSKTHVLWMKKTKSASHIVSPLVADVLHSQPKMRGQKQATGNECAKQGSTGIEQMHRIILQQCPARPIWRWVGR